MTIKSIFKCNLTQNFTICLEIVFLQRYNVTEIWQEKSKFPLKNIAICSLIFNYFFLVSFVVSIREAFDFSQGV